MGVGVAKRLPCIDYARWGPIFWPFLRSSARDPTIEAARGTVAIKGVFDNQKGLGSCYRGGGTVPLAGPLVPLRGDPFPLQASFNCFIVG